MIMSLEIESIQVEKVNLLYPVKFKIFFVKL